MRPANALILAAALLLLGGGAASADGPEPGDRAPELEVKDWLNGGPISIADCEGEAVVILFLHTAAPQMADYAKAYDGMLKTYGERGLKVIGVSRENHEILLNWSDEHEFKFPMAVDAGSWKGAYSINQGYPFAYVIDIYGEVAWKGDGNKVTSVIPQVERCLKEVKRITLKREDTSKSFDKVWRALDKNEYPNAIKFLQGLAKAKSEDDVKDAEELLKQIGAIADGRVSRATELEKRKDYGGAYGILGAIEKTFVGLPQAKAAKETREKWLKDPKIKAEIDAQRLLDEGRAQENARQFQRAAELYQAAMGFPGTRAASRASSRLADLRRRGFVR